MSDPTLDSVPQPGTGLDARLKSALERLTERIEAEQPELHALLLVHRGELVVERYRPGHSVTEPHRLYSVAKSFTALAIGALIDEGRLRLTDRVAEHFPEKLPATVHPWIAAMTVEDLLTMRTAHRITSFIQTEDTDWVRSFFTKEPAQRSGTRFVYDTAASVVLAALTEKLSGDRLEDFLLQRILLPLGFGAEARTVAGQPTLQAWRSPLGLSPAQRGGRPSWEPVPENPQGVTHGGSALFCTARDLARFAQLCLAAGRSGEKQILSEEFMAAATGWQTPTEDENFPCLENQQGYGYQFWRTRHQGFLAWGIGGQIVLCLPEHDFALITTGSSFARSDGQQKVFDAVFEELLPAMTPVSTAQTSLRIPGETR
ncbi:serine hydrolase domain-containing protein [Nesterenkonia sandarakina]|uniref:CubicO group peptidase (Beta-lactamase class C family) n=1 Tax=Nesterenkonia sandarakina TaxID=272918 RepID=A0A7Z0E756_9MICC|nr:serine hydrolase [Nesterenkonia sandarakina]NYJ16320.1 CubicO group peptidase (beta-lactamase class C family) [Nesterenkonia sandarakina]